MVGARNSRPAPEVVKVVGTFVEEINNRVRVATMVGAVDEFVLLPIRHATCRRIGAVLLKHICIGRSCCSS